MNDHGRRYYRDETYAEEAARKHRERVQWLQSLSRRQRGRK